MEENRPHPLDYATPQPKPKLQVRELLKKVLFWWMVIGVIVLLVDFLGARSGRH